MNAVMRPGIVLRRRAHLAAAVDSPAEKVKLDML